MIRKVGEKEIFRNRIFHIKELELLLDSGEKIYRQILDKGDSSLMVPINMYNELVLIKEYFPAIDEYQLGLPKGRIDPGFDPLLTANKELQEEIGYKAQKLQKLAVVTMSPGYITQRTHIFLATNLVESRLQGDEAEPLGIVLHPFDKFEILIEKGKLTEARMIAALFLAKKFFTRE